MRPIAVVGSLSLDRVDGGPPRIGGAPYYAARALRLLRGPARIVTKCAPSDRRILLPRLVALGVPVVWRPGKTTPGFTIRNVPGGREMRIDALGDPWRPEDVEGLAGVEWLHVAPLARSDFPPETLSALARGRRLSLDGQGLVRPPRTGPLRLDTDFDPALLEHVSVLKLSEDEARALVGKLDEASLGELGVPEVVVTLDVRGSLVLAGGRLHEVPARPVAAPDPTGAGDAFAAAYLDARCGGHAPVAAARRATALVAGLLSGRVR